MENEAILKHFAFQNDEMAPLSGEFCDLAYAIQAIVPAGPERSEALRKLLEAKDAALRAKAHPGG